jgi:hypothetical protein
VEVDADLTQSRAILLQAGAALLPFVASMAILDAR